MKPLQSTLVAFAVLSGGFFCAAHAQSTFGDVPDNHWAAAAVKRLAEAGIIEGFPAAPAAKIAVAATKTAPKTAAKSHQKSMAKSNSKARVSSATRPR
jgi:molybdopterin-guanine dinucleotide biosynthesis protein